MTINADDKLIPGDYKVLLGAATEQVSISKFVTVIIKSPTVLSLFESITFDDNEIES